MEKVAQKFGLLLQLKKKLPKVNNPPMDENSPSLATLQSRVARWFILKPKIPIWVYFGGP
jgi:hypothetical protein